jgi:hypothetical protein
MASAGDDLRKFHAVLRDLGEWLKATGVKGMVIGGVAVTLLGRPRMTRDVDALVWLPDDNVFQFLEAGKKWGFVSRISGPVEFAKQSHILVLRHTASNVPVDIAIGALPFERQAIESCQEIPLEDFRVAVPRPEDLILMKAVAQRDQDLFDIGGIIDKQTKLDKRYLRKRAKEFAAMLEQPGIVELIDRMLKLKRK